MTADGPVVIEVALARRLADPKFARMLDRTRKVTEARGWRCEVAHEPPKVEFLNIRFLAGYRRQWLFAGEVLDEVRQHAHGVAPRIHNRHQSPLVVDEARSRGWRPGHRVRLNPYVWLSLGFLRPGWVGDAHSGVWCGLESRDFPFVAEFGDP
jgi:hypothetical protein